MLGFTCQQQKNCVCSIRTFFYTQLSHEIKNVIFFYSLNSTLKWTLQDIRGDRKSRSSSSPSCCSSLLSAQRSPPPSPAAAPCRRSAPWSVQQTPEGQRRKEEEGQDRTTPQKFKQQLLWESSETQRRLKSLEFITQDFSQVLPLVIFEYVFLFFFWLQAVVVTTLSR